MPTLSIIIINWNTKNLLKDCIDSIYSTVKGISFEIIVADNASTDNSINLIDKYSKDITILINKENVGFAKANNQAIKTAQGDYILLLNPDTILKGDTINEMLRYLLNNPRTGIVGCRLTNPDGSHQVGDTGFYPSISTMFNHFFFFSKISPTYLKGYLINYNVKKCTHPIDVEWVSGACLMFRKALVNIIGYLPEAYFMYNEDLEFCKKGKEAGYEIKYLPYLDIIHYRGMSCKAQGKNFSSLWLISLFQYYKNNNEGTLKYFLFKLIVWAGLFIRCVLYSVMSVFLRKYAYNEKANEMWVYSKKVMEVMFNKG